MLPESWLCRASVTEQTIGSIRGVAPDELGELLNAGAGQPGRLPVLADLPEPGQERPQELGRLRGSTSGISDTSCVLPTDSRLRRLVPDRRHRLWLGLIACLSRAAGRGRPFSSDRLATALASSAASASEARRSCGLTGWFESNRKVKNPSGVGIVASDDERESPMGFLRVERVPLGGDIAAVRICERSPGRRPGSRGDRRCVTRPSTRHALALA